MWKRAQAEIDAVIGTDRLPEFEDRPSLPYIDAIVRETLRWRPVLPMGAFSGMVVPHVFSTIPKVSHTLRLLVISTMATTSHAVCLNTHTCRLVVIELVPQGRPSLQTFGMIS